MKREAIIDFNVENPNLYRIVWKSKTSDISAVGSYTCTKDEADNSVRELNHTYPDYHHWTEPNPRLN